MNPFGPEAGIPEGAVLSAEEISQSSDAYQGYLNQTADRLNMNVPYARYFDIKILNAQGLGVQGMFHFAAFASAAARLMSAQAMISVFS